MATYNRQWLQNQIGAYSHDRNLGALADTFIDIAITKISNILESQYNENSQLVTITSNPWTLPDDVVSVSAVGFQGGAILRSLPTHQIRRYPETGTPAFYRIKVNNVRFIPFMAGEYGIRYFSRINLLDDPGATHPALTAYPFVFLDAALAECYDYKQDAELMQRYQDKWLAEVHEINRVTSKLRAGDAPAMEAM